VSIPRPRRRVPLQELFTQSDKHAHALREWLQNTLYSSLSEMSELSRPRRKHSAYPKLVALQNGLENLHNTATELRQNGASMLEWLHQIDENVQRQKGPI
jgi:hypothetical protein